MNPLYVKKEAKEYFLWTRGNSVVGDLSPKFTVPSCLLNLDLRRIEFVYDQDMLNMYPFKASGYCFGLYPIF